MILFPPTPQVVRRAAAAFLMGGMWLAAVAQNAPDTMAYRNTVRIFPNDSQETILQKAVHVVPTPNQLAALRNEFIAFIHLGPNTFTKREWGTGDENPAIFVPQNLDTDQWCRTLKQAGMRMVVLTAKHHDGFVLWQSRYTRHGIMSSPFQNGNGDIMRNLSQSCRKYGLKLGVYLSPADLYQMNDKGLYGNLSKKTLRTIPRAVENRPFANGTTFRMEVDDYNEYFLNQLFELLTEYGDISEVWFDGAHPKQKGGQTYDYLAWKKLIRTLAPNAVIFGREDVRWGGNESGATRASEWNVIPYHENPNEMTRFHDLPGADLGSREKLYAGRYLHYQQAEIDTSIREGWFYRDDHTQNVRSADDIFDIYERTVGGNATFILNIPPNREGLFAAADVAALQETGKRIRDTYDTDLLAGATDTPKELTDGNDETFVEYTAPMVMRLPQAVTLNRVTLQEPVAKRGERVEAHAIDAWINGAWQEVSRATNIGYKRILRFDAVTTDRLRLRILQTRATPFISTIAAHFYNERPPVLHIEKNRNGMVTIAPRKQTFAWHGEQKTDAPKVADYEIFYTVDNSTPTASSKRYAAPFALSKGVVKAVAIRQNERGAVAQRQLGYTQKDWKVRAANTDSTAHAAAAAFDADPKTYWRSGKGGAQSLSVSFGKPLRITGLAYTPQTENSEGMIEQMEVYYRKADGKWQKAESISFGNLINSPTQRFHYFKKPFSAKEVRIKAVRIAAEGNHAAIAELDFF